MTEPRAVARGALLATALTAALAAGDAQALPKSFASLVGAWSGSGTLTMANGARDRLRCRAHYAPGSQSNSLRLSIRCASDTYNFDLASDVVDEGGAISGEWREATHNAGGRISGRVRGNRIDVVARGGTFSASLSVTTSGNWQSVAITPQGAEVTQVSLTLNRR